MTCLPKLLAIRPLLLAAGFVVVAAAQASAGECPNPGPVSIAVAVYDGSPKYVNTETMAQVTTMAGLPSSAGARQAQNALGLTHSAFEQRFVVDVDTTPGSDGQPCVWVRNVKAYIGFTKMDVFIASEYSPGSCQYQAVLAHENEHVRRNRDTLHRHLPNFQAALRQAAEAVGPMRASIPVAARQAADQIENGLRPSFAVLEASLKKSNTDFDSPQEYSRLHNDCATW